MTVAVTEIQDWPLSLNTDNKDKGGRNLVKLYYDVLMDNSATTKSIATGLSQVLWAGITQVSGTAFTNAAKIAYGASGSVDLTFSSAPAADALFRVAVEGYF